MPNNCKCKVKMHATCFDQIISTGLLCPICRIRSNNFTDDLAVNIRIIGYNNESIIDIIYGRFIIIILGIIYSIVFLQRGLFSHRRKVLCDMALRAE